MRLRFLPLLILALAPLASEGLVAKEVLWRVETAKKTKVVYEEGAKKYNWSWARNDPTTISPFSPEEKRWMQAIFPSARFRLLKNGADGYPDEFLVLPDRRVLAKDDVFPVPAGEDGSQALFFLIRPPDGLLAADGGDPVQSGVVPRSPAPPPPPPPPASQSAIDLDRLLYMDDPPAPEDLPPAPAPPPPPEPEPQPAPRVDRTRLGGELHFLVLEGQDRGAFRVTHRSRPVGPFPGMDIHRIRSFPLGTGLAFGIAFGWQGEGAGARHFEYRLFSRGPWGVAQAWAARVLDFPADPLARRGTRFRFSLAEGGSGEPELLVREVNLSSVLEAPDLESFLPPAGGRSELEEERGVVDIHRLRKGRFKKIGRADRAKGDAPVDLRRNWPDYLARASRGPSRLLSFGNPGSPFEAYPCSWPGHPAAKVPWVEEKAYLFKGEKLRRGAADLSLATWFLHDPQALYFMAVVRDDDLVLPALDGDPSQGDHLQLWLDPQYRDRSLMLEVFPGSPPGAGAFARVRSPSSLVGPATRVRVAARPFESGYWLEAAIPFRYLEELGLRPTGSLWGFAVNAVDVDRSSGAEKAVLSTSKAFEWARPSSFNNLILE